ncbi:MAG: DNA polymerase [Pyrinomonadaceae bacterium]
MDTNYKLVTNAEDLRIACDELSQQSIVGFDTETTSLDPYSGRVRLVQFAAPGGSVYIIDLDCFSGGNNGGAANNGDGIYHDEALAPLKKLLAAARPVKIAHNAKFDAKWIKRQLDVELGGLFDTLLASQLVSAGNTEDRHSLEVVAARYLEERVDKAEQLSDWNRELSEAQLEYAARDAAILVPLRERLVERLKAENLIQCATLEFDCVLPVAGLELAGFYLDQARWREQIANVEQLRARLAGELQGMLAEGTMQQASLFGETRVDFNIDSHVQLTKALKRLGVPVPDSTRNWKLQPLAEEYPVVKKLLEYRTVQKSLTSYGENILDPKSGYINPHTQRIHANFHQIGAPTGRFACLTGDALVATPVGFKRMDALREDDFVKTSYGFKRVEKAWMNGTRRVYKIQLKDGRSIRATEDHRFLAGKADTWKRLNELRIGDKLYTSLKIFESEASDASEQLDEFYPLDINFPEVRSRKPVTVPTTLSIELCELAGLIVADGFLGVRHERPVTKRRLSGTPALYDRVCIAFERHDQDVIDRMMANGAKLFGQTFVEVKAQTCRLLQLASTRVAQFLAEFGLRGNAHTKAVPLAVLGASTVYQAAFLRGLFEGDGHRSESMIGLTSVNHKLLSQAQLMLSNMGIYSTIKQRNDRSGFSGAVRFALSINKKSDINRFMSKIGFISGRKSRPFNFTAQITDGIPTPFVVSGAQLYREAVAVGTTPPSRTGVKPFITYYKNSYIKSESVEKLIARFGQLPSLKPIVDCLDLELRPVEIESITVDEIEKVYDITVEGVHEFIADGIVVHNCTQPNIQQVPHATEYRRCFRAPDNRKLIIADYSQVELRILAHITGDQGFIDAFNSGADLHRVTAAQVFGVPLDEVTADQRSFAKRLNFGVVYGIGAQRFSMMTGLSLTESEDILRRYFATYRALDTWLREAARRAVRERTARTLSNRLARFTFDPADKQAASLAQRNGKNMPIQGSSADILKRALRLLHDKLKDTSARIVNIVHDEIVVEADACDAEEIARTVEAAMCAAGEEYVTRVPIKVETEIADEWVK